MAPDAPSSVIHFERGMDRSADFTIIRSLFKFGLPTGVQGIAMNVGGVLMLRFIGSLEQSAAAQAAYAVCYTQLFSLITWTSNGLLGAAATIAGQNLGAGNPDRAVEGVRVASRIGLAVAAIIGLIFVPRPRPAAGDFRHERSGRPVARAAAAALSERLGAVHHRCAQLHGRPPGHRRHAQPALHLDDFAGHHSARPVHDLPGHPRPTARRHLDGHRDRPHDPLHPELDRFRQQKWRNIRVDIEHARP